MRSLTLYLVSLPILAAALVLACGRSTGVPDGASSNETQKLPFDREPQSTGISPTHSFVPAVSRLPEGTPLIIRLQKSVSSASARAGDTFTSTVDDPVVVNGETAVERGTAVIGRVLAAKASAGRDPGYLRIAIVSLDVDGKSVAIETSSIFAKGGSHEKRPPARNDGTTDSASRKEASFDANRRLTFRLAEPVELH